MREKVERIPCRGAMQVHRTGDLARRDPVEAFRVLLAKDSVRKGASRMDDAAQRGTRGECVAPQGGHGLWIGDERDARALAGPQTVRQRPSRSTMPPG